MTPDHQHWTYDRNARAVVLAWQRRTFPAWVAAARVSYEVLT